MFMLVCFAIATHHGAQGTLWRAAGSNHICDHYVTDKGPKGQCGGKHPRIKCNNPNKCDKPV